MNCWNSSGILEEFQRFHLFQSFSSNFPRLQWNSTGIPPELWKDFLVGGALLVVLTVLISSSSLSLIFSNLLNNPYFLSSSLNALLNILPNGEYSSLVCSIVLGLRSKSSTVNNSYLSKLLEESTDILAASLSKSYCDLFCLVFLFKI